ncbi:uncharacterized protein LOC110048702 [Orbicella faveolata]|uniref:uncharacterized protein LOC110048702 n=1 Tax=Orbicella faveolata TaxID=48498 RepID=UPI0009E4C6A7|nr:uncharacterized protein LOC110048702 [Orbicella faveolata]
MTADLPWRQLIDRSIANSVVCDRVRAIDVIIWDEASMSSQRMFELVNCLHHELEDDQVSRTLPFAGKQLILVGEFLQLQPVPNIFDEGCYMFESPLFDLAISHRFALTKVMRQSENDKHFLNALAEIRLGRCSKDSEEYICSLKRNLSADVEESTTHIFFRKIPVTLMNRKELDKLPGELLVYNASFENDNSRSMSWPGVEVLQLKRGCKVMLVWNLSENLKNGSVGVFTGARGDDLLVFFEDVGVVEISRQTWIKRNLTGQKMGGVTQFPLVLAYAVTCHKSQGLTLASAIVHCSREYVSGLIYVAISRVKSPEHIQILDFSPRQLLRPPRRAVEICSSQHLDAPVADMSCCRNKNVNSDIFHSVKDRYHEYGEDDDPFSFPSELLDGPARASFEDDEVAIPMELMEVYRQLLTHESILATPPQEVMMSILDLLPSMKSNAVSTFWEEKNNAIDCLLSESSLEKVKCFAKLVWFHYYLMVENHVVENPDEILVEIGRQGFTAVTSSLHKFFIGIDFSRYVCALFDATASTPPQRAVAVQLATSVYRIFLEQLVSVVKQQRQEETIDFDVDQMSGVGRSKVRHVGGWAVRKVLNRYRKYIQGNVFTKCSSTLARVETQQIACQLLEENVIRPYSELEENSMFPDTLEVTAPLSRVYSKSQLVALCEAYNVRVSASSTKTVIGEALLNAITQHIFVPFTSPVDDRIFQVAERSESDDGHIRIRLSRGKCNDINLNGNGSFKTTDCKLSTL